MTTPSPAPTTVGRYEILKELGRGVMGVVYEAHDPILHRSVALKTINITFASSPAERDAFGERFLAEARIAARLAHPGIVVVHDVGRDETTGLLFISLERLPGETLDALMARGERLPWRKCLDIVRRVAEALQHAHEQGVIHRDVKPANIMLLPSGLTKVLDFGIAKVEAAHITAAGQFFGTPLYMSPEQALGQSVDARSDVFSLGSVAYALLTGKQAFEDDSIMKILGRVAYQDPRAPSQLDPGLPAEIDYLLGRALAKNPDDRYPDGRTWIEDIDDVLAGKAPRHQAAWAVPTPADAPDIGRTLVARLGRVGSSATMTMEPPAGASGPRGIAFSPSASPAPARPGQPAPRGPLWVAGALFGLAGLFWIVWPTPMAVAPPPPTAATEAPAVTEAATAAPSPEPTATDVPATATPAPAPARVVVDLEHGLKAGRLRLWLDGEEMLVERFKGNVTANLVVFKLRTGMLTEVLDVVPGRHEVRAQVSWDGGERTGTIPGRFRSGETYRLQVRLSRRKEMTLNWTR